jgi:dimeric dUTPase (all-alpha-NTP-PPase superfamily)
VITIDKIEQMLALQDRLNKVINPNWAAANYPWHRAIMVEGVEALDHYGWKWWKKHEPDIQQAKIELVDIWHFALSMYLEANECDHAKAAGCLHVDLRDAPPLEGLSVAEKLDTLVSTAGSEGFDVPAFVSLMPDFALSWDDLYAIYIGKNVLNLFRQANGYKDGTYVKIWNGLEDNVHLDRIMAENPDASTHELHEHLRRVYALAAPSAVAA